MLFLGSFPPPQKRWSINFFYPNYINDHWRIEGQIFYGDKDHFVDLDHKCFIKDSIVDHCTKYGIAFFDTATAVRRLKDNASDKFLEVVEPTDISALLNKIPDCRTIVTTGEKACQTICDYLNVTDMPKVGGFINIPTDNLKVINRDLRLYRLPSSSRAYPLSFDKKVEAYKKMFAAELSLSFE